MKRILKNRLFIVIITLMIGISGTLYATTKYNASDVLYSDSNGETMNVNDALNELYNNNNKNISEISVTASGSYASQTLNFSNGEKEALIIYSLARDVDSTSISINSYSNCTLDLIVNEAGNFKIDDKIVFIGKLYVWHIKNIEENASITFNFSSVYVAPYAIIKIK